jgi:predicted nuclease of restriction endonuclease-like (RecB) superfamily
MKAKKTAPRKNTALARGGGLVPAVAKLATEIQDLIEAARSHVSVTANLAMVNLYWNIGRVIAQDIQKNEKRAGYGEQLLERLSDVLTREYGAGYSRVSLQEMRRFSVAFQICQTVSNESAIHPIRSTSSNESPILPSAAAESAVSEICQTASSKLARREILQTPSAESCEPLLIDFHKHFRLGWSHYRVLLSQGDPLCRKFYFEQAAEQRWTVRELRRQIDRGLFERAAFSRDTPRLVAQEKRMGPAEIVRYEDIFKDPYVLDFLGLKGAYSERDLEAAIVRNLEQFLTELGTDFCFIGRQYAMRIDEDDYFLDLLFYHRGLRCLVAIDLKIGTFTAADKGQMDLYLAWLKEHDWRESENEPVGLILCTSARRQHVELLLRHGPHKMKVAEYLTRLPDKRLLEDRLKMYSKLLMEQRPSTRQTDRPRHKEIDIRWI